MCQNKKGFTWNGLLVFYFESWGLWGPISEALCYGWDVPFLERKLPDWVNTAGQDCKMYVIATKLQLNWFETYTQLYLLSSHWTSHWTQTKQFNKILSTQRVCQQISVISYLKSRLKRKELTHLFIFPRNTPCSVSFCFKVPF